MSRGEGRAARERDGGKELTRTFVALLIPDEWKQYLGGCSRALAEGTSGLSWVKSENFHLTIRFLGDLGDSGVRRVSESVAASAEGLDAPLGRLGPVGAFPNFKRPRVIWVGLAEGGEVFDAVARTVNEGLDRKGFGPPDKPSRAHITLARVREGAKGLDRIGSAALPTPPAAAVLDRICVMKSELHPAGSRYTAIQECHLRPPGGAPTPRP